MKTTIDLKDLKKYINTLSRNKDEWYGPKNFVAGDFIANFLEWNDKNEIAKEFRHFLYDLETD